VRNNLDIRCHFYIVLSVKLARALNRQTAQTQVKAGVKPEPFKVFNITKMLLDVNRMQAIARRVPAKHPLKPSNSDPTADSKP
jgi:hypothetical protein